MVQGQMPNLKDGLTGSGQAHDEDGEDGDVNSIPSGADVARHVLGITPGPDTPEVPQRNPDRDGGGRSQSPPSKDWLDNVANAPPIKDWEAGSDGAGGDGGQSGGHAGGTSSTPTWLEEGGSPLHFSANSDEQHSHPASPEPVVLHRSAVESYMATHGFTASKHEQLTFKKGDLFTISQKLPIGWWFGTLLATGHSGWLPATHVRLCNIGHSAAGGGGGGHGNPNNVPSMRGGSLPVRGSVPAPRARRSNSPNSPPPQQQQQQQHQFPTDVHVAKYSFQAERPEQLSFVKRDRLRVQHKEQNGWWKGDLLGGNGGAVVASGWFPGSYVKRLKQKSKKIGNQSPDPAGFAVELTKGPNGSVGLGLAGGTADSPVIYVSDIRAGSPAAATGLLQLGDVLLAVNGESLARYPLKGAIKLLKRSGSPLWLQFRRVQQGSSGGSGSTIDRGEATAKPDQMLIDQLAESKTAADREAEIQASKHKALLDAQAITIERERARTQAAKEMVHTLESQQLDVAQIQAIVAETTRTTVEEMLRQGGGSNPISPLSPTVFFPGGGANSSSSNSSMNSVSALAAEEIARVKAEQATLVTQAADSIKQAAMAEVRTMEQEMEATMRAELAQRSALQSQNAAMAMELHNSKLEVSRLSQARSSSPGVDRQAEAIALALMAAGKINQQQQGGLEQLNTTSADANDQIASANQMAMTAASVAQTAMQEIEALRAQIRAAREERKAEAQAAAALARQPPVQSNSMDNEQLSSAANAALSAESVTKATLAEVQQLKIALFDASSAKENGGGGAEALRQQAELHASLVQQATTAALSAENVAKAAIAEAEDLRAQLKAAKEVAAASSSSSSSLSSSTTTTVASTKELSPNKKWLSQMRTEPKGVPPVVVQKYTPSANDDGAGDVYDGFGDDVSIDEAIAATPSTVHALMTQRLSTGAQAAQISSGVEKLDRDAIYRMFSKLDRDGDGSLSFDEIAYGMKEDKSIQVTINALMLDDEHYGVVGDAHGNVTAQEFISVLDKNGDNCVTVLEFIRGLGTAQHRRLSRRQSEAELELATADMVKIEAKHAAATPQRVSLHQMAPPRSAEKIYRRTSDITEEEESEAAEALAETKAIRAGSDGDDSAFSKAALPPPTAVDFVLKGQLLAEPDDVEADDDMFAKAAEEEEANLFTDAQAEEEGEDDEDEDGEEDGDGGKEAGTARSIVAGPVVSNVEMAMRQTLREKAFEMAELALSKLEAEDEAANSSNAANSSEEWHVVGSEEVPAADVAEKEVQAVRAATEWQVVGPEEVPAADVAEQEVQAVRAASIEAAERLALREKAFEMAELALSKLEAADEGDDSSLPAAAGNNGSNDSNDRNDSNDSNDDSDSDDSDENAPPPPPPAAAMPESDDENGNGDGDDGAKERAENEPEEEEEVAKSILEAAKDQMRRGSASEVLAIVAAEAQEANVAAEEAEAAAEKAAADAKAVANEKLAAARAAKAAAEAVAAATAESEAEKAEAEAEAKAEAEAAAAAAAATAESDCQVALCKEFFAAQVKLATGNITPETMQEMNGLMATACAAELLMEVNPGAEGELLITGDFRTVMGAVFPTWMGFVNTKYENISFTSNDRNRNQVTCVQYIESHLNDAEGDAIPGTENRFECAHTLTYTKDGKVSGWKQEYEYSVIAHARSVASAALKAAVEVATADAQEFEDAANEAAAQAAVAEANAAAAEAEAASLEAAEAAVLEAEAALVLRHAAEAEEAQAKVAAEIAAAEATAAADVAAAAAAERAAEEAAGDRSLDVGGNSDAGGDADDDDAPPPIPDDSDGYSDSDSDSDDDDGPPPPVPTDGPPPVPDGPLPDEDFDDDEKEEELDRNEKRRTSLVSALSVKDGGDGEVPVAPKSPGSPTSADTDAEAKRLLKVAASTVGLPTPFKEPLSASYEDNRRQIEAAEEAASAAAAALAMPPLDVAAASDETDAWAALHAKRQAEKTAHTMELQERRKRAQADARRLAQAKAKAEADAREKAAEARKRKLDAVAKMDRAKETERLHAMNAATELESSRRVAAQQARDRVSDEARLRAEAAQAKMLEAQQKEEALAQALEEKKERLRQEKKQLRKAEDRRRKSMGSANSFADEAQRLAAGRRERMGLPSDPEEDVGGGTATPSARKAAAAAAVIASPRRRAAALAAAGDGDGDAEAEVEAEAEAEATSNKLLFSPPSAANAPTPEPEGFFSPPSAANAPTPDLEFEPSNQSPVRGGVQTTSAMARATKGWVPKKINDGISAESELAKRMRESKTRRATFLKEFQIDDDTAAAAAAVPPTPVAAVQGYEAHTPTPSTPPPPTTATASTTPSASASFAAAAASPMSAAGTPPVGGRTNQFRKSRTGGTTPLPTPRTPTSTGETWQQKLKREKEAKLQSFATVSSIVTSPLKQEKAQPGSLIARVSVQHRGNTVIRRPKSIHDDMSQTEDFTVLASKIKAKKLQRLKEEAEARKSPHQKAAARARPRRGSVRDIAQDHAEVLHVHAASALPPPRVSWQSKLKQERAAKAAAEAEQLVRDQEKAARNSAYLLEKAEKAEKASKAKSKYLQSMGAR